MFQHKCSLLTSLVAAGLALVSGIIAQAQTSYSFRDLGTLGGTSSSATGVNNAGQVVGASTLANGAAHGFYWSAGTGMVDIPTFGGTGGGAKGLNNVGDVVGHATNAAGVWHAFLWNSSTHALTDLNSLLSATDASNWVLTYAWKVNNNRQVIGQGIKGGATYYNAYVLDLNTGTLTDMGVFGPHGINNLLAPQVVGDNSGVSYLYSNGSTVSLASLTSAKDTNNMGAIVGYLPNAHAAYRSPAGVITDLGEWGGAAGLASANSINNASTPMVVGDSNYYQKGSVLTHRAFRWIVGNGAMQDLNSLTSNLGRKMILFGANCVSDTGYIACQQDPAGYSTGNTHAFLLTPQ